MKIYSLIQLFYIFFRLLISIRFRNAFVLCCRNFFILHLFLMAICFLFPTIAVAKNEIEQSGQVSSTYSTFSEATGNSFKDLNTQQTLLKIQWDFILQNKSSQRKDFLQSWKFEINPRFQSDLQSQDSAEKNDLQWRELSLTGVLRNSETVKLGFTTINWEGTDFINPMDVMSVGDFRDPLSPQKKSSLAFLYTAERNFQNDNSLTWDLVYVPIQSKASLPSEHSLWWPRKLQFPLQTDQFTLQLPNQVSYRILSDEELNHATANNFGSRLHLRMASTEFSLAAKEGMHNTPLLLPALDVSLLSLSPKLIFLLQSPVKIQPVYYRERQGALGLNYYADSWVFRSAGVHSQPLGTDSRLPSYSDQYVLGLEKTITFSTQSITLLLEKIETKTASAASASENTSTLTKLFDQAWLLGWRWPFNERWTWSSAGMQEQKTKSTFVHQSLDWKISDHWQLNLTADILSGSEDSSLGVYDQNDRYGINWAYSF